MWRSTSGRCWIATVISIAGCAADAQTYKSQKQTDEVDATQDSVIYADETEHAIDRAVAAGRSLGVDADAEHQRAIATLRDRNDAVERVVARAKQTHVTRKAYVGFLGYLGRDSEMARQYLVKLALTKPASPDRSAPPDGQHDEKTEYESQLGEAFAAAYALIKRGDTAALLDVYANADENVAVVAAASAARMGILDQGAIQTLNSRGITGSFQPLGQDVLTLRNVTAGPDPVAQPMTVGPQ